MAKAPETTTAVAPVGAAALPAHLQGGRTAKVGNLDTTDLIIPRMKLLQAISPEVETFNEAKSGQFWHSIADRSLGDSVQIVPIVIRKSYVLWAPRNDDRGILARANDAVHWDVAEDFEVKPKGSPNKIIWSTKPGTVSESGLDQFGSSIPGDPRSVPAATLQYNIMAFMPQYPELSPVLLLNARSAIRPAKKLISNLELSNVDHYGRLFEVGRVQETGDEGPYWNYSYTGAGFADVDTYNICKALYEKFAAADFRANDEGEDVGDTKPAEGGTVGGKKNAF